jgi:hypothetical protein
MTQKPKRHWYQFSLSTMFVAVTILSIPLAWVGYSLNWIRQRNHAIESGIVDPSHAILVPCGMERIDAPGRLGLFGETGYALIVLAEPRSPRSIKIAKRLFPEAETVDASNWP